MKAIATFAAACTLALAFAAPAAAAPVDGFDFRQIGTDGNSCQLVISTYSNAPVTRWDRKRGQVFLSAIAPAGSKCPKEYQSLPVNSYVSYKIDGRVFTAYTSRGAKQIFYRAYGDRYNFRWVSAPKPPQAPK